MSEVKFKPGQMTYSEARRYASNGLLRVDPDDLMVLLELAEEFGMDVVTDDFDPRDMGLG